MIRRQLYRIQKLSSRHTLIAGGLLAIGITLFMTSISMYLYVRSGASGLDLSRPGLSKERANIQREKTFNFSSTGKMAQSDYEAFKKLYDEQRSLSQAAGNFDAQVLCDEALGLTITPPGNE